MDLNSEKYWEHRFQTDWIEKHGSEQTLMHYEALVEHLPDYIIDLINENSYTICDMGCGLGEGTNEIQKTFTSSLIYGMDFSQTAVDDANKNYGSDNVRFIKGDMLTQDQYYDVIILSHVLEHFKNPHEILDNLSQYSKYVIVFVPFREKNMHKEHEFRFDYPAFPLKINNKRLIFFKEVPPIFFAPGDGYMQEQMLVIYADDELSEGYSLANLNSYYDEKLRQDREIKKLKSSISKLKKENKEKLKLEEEIKKLKSSNSKLKKENDHFKSTKAYRFWQFYANLK